MAALRACLQKSSVFLRPVSRLYATNHPIERSINKVTLLGRVGIDPKSKGTEKRPVTVFSLGTNSLYTDPKTQELKQSASWHTINVFRPGLRDTIYKKLKKGDRCLVKGMLSHGVVVKENGESRSISTVIADDVIFLTMDDQIVNEE